MGRHRRIFGLLAVLVTAVLAGGEAQAGELSRSADGSILTYTADPGAFDSLSVSNDPFNPGMLVFTTGSGGDSITFAAGSGCAPGAGSGEVVCSIGDLTRLVFNLGDVGDSASVGSFDVSDPAADLPMPVTLNGGDGADTLGGGPKADLLTGGAGGDSMSGDLGGGSAGNDQLDGGDGDDSLSGTAGDDQLDGGDGDDNLSGGDGADLLIGGAGTDVHMGQGGVDTLRARDGVPEQVDCGNEGGSAVVDGGSLVAAKNDSVLFCQAVDASAELIPDADGDGVARPADCDDLNPAFKPGAPDLRANGIDEDCSGTDAAPVLESLLLEPPILVAARGGPSARPARRRVGALVVYRLDGVSANVRFNVERRTTGRQVGRRCRRATRRNRKGRPCALYVPLRGSFEATADQGFNAFRFTGRLGGRRLRPGRYRLVGTPRGPTGVAGGGRAVAFRIVRR